MLINQFGSGTSGYYLPVYQIYLKLLIEYTATHLTHSDKDQNNRPQAILWSERKENNPNFGGKDM